MTGPAVIISSLDDTIGSKLKSGSSIEDMIRLGMFLVPLRELAPDISLDDNTSSLDTNKTSPGKLAVFTAL